MPNAFIEKIAKQKKVSKEKVEKYWKRAKKIAKDKFKKEDDAYYAYTTGIFKRMMQLSSNANYRDFAETLPSIMRSSSECTDKL